VYAPPSKAEKRVADAAAGCRCGAAVIELTRRRNCMGKLTGKAAVVTGAARGLGRAYALRLADLGANVGVIDLDLRSFADYAGESALLTAETVVDEIEARGVAAAGVEADATDPEAVKTAIVAIAKDIGDPTIAVCNAGGGIQAKTTEDVTAALTRTIASELSFDDLAEVVARNWYSTVATVKGIVPYMKRRQEGKIVTVASMAAVQPSHDGTNAGYGSAKAAIITYTRYLAKELGPYGITVNCIAPGYIATARPMLQFDTIGLGGIIDRIALRRLGTREDCAGVVEFLTTDLSDYVTGVVIEVDGSYC